MEDFDSDFDIFAEPVAEKKPVLPNYKKIVQTIESGLLEDNEICRSLGALASDNGEASFFILLDHLKHHNSEVVVAALNAISTRLDSNVPVSWQNIAKPKVERALKALANG
jgi:hypothetical protein